MRFAIAKFLPDRDVAIGLGVQNVTFQLTPLDQDPLFAINGTGGVRAARPACRGGGTSGSPARSSPGSSAAASRARAIPSTAWATSCRSSVASPARLIAGVAYRFAATEWNQLVGGTFRDERSLTVTADVLVTGPSPNAYGIEAFAMQQLQRSGAEPVVSVRAGAEWESLPGRLRLRAGSYWEPGRFVGVGGRLHVTFGVELRVFEFDVWGRRRGRLSFTADVAERYRNIAVSVGFWH